MHTVNKLHISSLRTASRLKAVVAVLLKYGFEELLTGLGFSCGRPLRPKCAFPDMSVWRKLRFAIEDLGPTAIKIGQAASMRPDLIPPQLAFELKDLHEDVHEEPYDDIAAVVTRSLGRPISEVFSSFEKKPVAAASLSQVHRAVLKADGATVAVKVRRPGLVTTILADLDILAYLAGLMHERVPSLKSANLPELVGELRKSLLREVDFVNEAQNISIFRANFADEPAIFAPKVYMEYAAEEVLVMEFVEGVRIDRLQAGMERRKRLADLGLAGTSRMMLEHGFFHADPHFGNLRITADDRICFLDWGMVGRLTPSMRSALVDYILALVKRDAAKVADVALTMAVKTPPMLDRLKFETDVMFILERVQAPTEGQANLGRFLIDLTELCRSYGVHLRSDYVLMARALMSIEAAGKVINPDFDVMGALKPIASRYLIRRATLLLSDKPILGRLEENLDDLIRLPVRMDRVLAKVEAGDISTEFRLRGLVGLQHVLRKAADRLAQAIIVAALVLGSALLIRADIGPHLWGMPLLGAVGFIMSGVLGVVVLWQIMFAKDA